MADSVLLAIDTASCRGSLALFRGNRLMAEKELPDRDSFSTVLVSGIGQALSDSGLAIGDVGIFSAVTGPGFFTGIRIGLTTIKGLVFDDAPILVGIHRLEAIARGCEEPERLIVVLEDARREEVYRGIYRRDTGGITAFQPPDLAHHLQMLSGLPKDAAGALFVGSGAERYRELIGQRYPDSPVRPGKRTLAVDAGRLALEKVAAGRFLRDPGRLIPRYLRHPDIRLGK